jgi:hypothetical protein
VVMACIAPSTAARAQQVADSTFDTRVERPAYATEHPRILFDEAHHNFHTSTGRYQAFAELARNDGYAVTPNARRFTAETLAGHHVLVIANALGDEDMAAKAAAKPAFTRSECDAVRDWVREGGALLLIADHAPMGASASPLAARFGVRLMNGYTVDSTLADPRFGAAVLRFTREGGSLGDHPITRGRDSTERISVIETFAGESLQGPPGSAPLLALSDRAEDLMVGLGGIAGPVPPGRRRSAAGRSQGLAFTFGKGRVVVLGEAAMMSAQVAGPQRVRIGMNAPGIDNRQFALNTLHWLTGLLR